jgi:hypothetical protein
MVTVGPERAGSGRGGGEAIPQTSGGTPFACGGVLFSDSTVGGGLLLPTVPAPSGEAPQALTPTAVRVASAIRLTVLVKRLPD